LTLIVVAVGALVVVGIPTQPLVAAVNRQLEPVGYRMRIDGPANISLWPALDFVAREVAFTDAKGPTGKDRVTAESVRIGVSIKDLLGGNIHVTDLTVRRPVVQVEADEARDRRATEGRGSADKGLAGVTLDRLTVEDGLIVVRSARRASELKVEGVRAVAKLDSGPLDIKAEGRIGRQHLRLAATTDASPPFAEGKATSFDATVELPGLLQPPAAITASVKWFDRSVGIDEITGTAGGSRLFGTMSLDIASGTPSVTADLELERLDLTSFIDQDAIAPRGGQAAWSDRPFDLSGLNLFNASLKLLARELRFGKVHIEPARLNMTLHDGVLSVVPTRLELYGGSAKGTLTIDASGQTPAYSGQVELANVAALSFLDDAFDFRNLDGRGRMKADLKASGASARAIVASLGGTTDLTFENGELKGVSIPQMVQSVASHILNGWQGTSSGRTEFVTFGASFRLDRGRATTDNMRIVGPLLRSPGKGTVDLNTLTLDMRVDPKVVLDQPGQSLEPTGIGVPVVIRGPWSDPQIYPELAGVLDNPEAAYAGLKNIFGRLTTTKPAQPGQPGNLLNSDTDDTINTLIDSIGSLLGPPKRPQSRGSGDAPPRTEQNAPARSDSPGRAEGPPASEQKPQPRADDQQRAREFLKNLFGN
jgi:AsmA protein